MKKNLLAILRTLVFVLPLSLCFVSCEGFDLDEILGNIIKPSEDDYVTVSEDKLFFDSKSSSSQLTVSSSGEWSVEESVDWLTLSPANGVDGDRLVVSVSANPTEAERHAEFTIGCGDAVAKVSVTQSYRGSDDSVVEYTIIEEVIDDIVGGMVATNGLYCLLQKSDTIDGYVCYMGDSDTEELPLLIRLDTFMTVRSIHCDETTYDFLYNESSFDIIVSDKDGILHIEDVSYDIFSSPRTALSSSRAGGISNGMDGWEAMANNINTIASIGEIASKPGALSSKIGVVTLIGGMSENKYVRRSSMAVDLVMALKNGGWLAAIWGVYQLGKEACYDEWFGDVAITTLGAEHITDTKYRVWCSVTNYAGISHPENMSVEIRMTLMKRPVILGNVLNGDNLTVEVLSIYKDGAYYFEFDNLELGEQYCFQPRLYRTWMENVGGAANMTFSDIFISGAPVAGVTTIECRSDVYMYGDVGTFATNSSDIESIDIDDVVATSDMLEFSMTVKGKGYAAPNNDDETLGQGSLGVYIDKGDKNYSYYRATSISGDDFTSEFNVQYSKSDMDEVDLSSFKAVKEIEIGSYVMAYRQTDLYDYECVYYYSESESYELVYDEHPEVLTGEVVSVENTEATIKCSFGNCLFWTTLRGVEYFTDGTTDVKTLDSGKEDGTHGFHLTDLKSNTTYKYRAYCEVNGVKEYGETKSFKTKGSDLCDDANHVHAVDLGLSVKWACCNVGASSPEGYGGYYAWGETEEKSNYTPLTYKYYLGDLDGDGYYYDSNEYQNIGSNISGTSYDVAHVKWGGSWRMPTLDEIKELCNKCSWQWTEVNGIKGQKVTGPNGNSIFLPAAGYRYGTDVYSRGSIGYCWSATSGEYDSNDAYSLDFGSGYDYWDAWSLRYFGHTVRPVTE